MNYLYASLHVMERGCTIFKDEGMPCNTSKCAKYEVKPDEVLDGGECIEYDK